MRKLYKHEQETSSGGGEVTYMNALLWSVDYINFYEEVFADLNLEKCYTSIVQILAEY